jgi:hypothetical protein
MPNYPVRAELVRIRQEAGTESVNPVGDENNNQAGRDENSLQPLFLNGGNQNQDGREDGNAILADANGNLSVNSH